MIKVKFFASYSETLGRDEIMVELKDDNSVSALLGIIIREHPKLGELNETMVISVNREYATYDTILKEGDEVAILPPVSGG